MEKKKGFNGNIRSKSSGQIRKSEVIVCESSQINGQTNDQ